MALLDDWRAVAYNTQTDKKQLQQFWSDYFLKEKAIYEQLLKAPDDVVKGTVKELAQKYGKSAAQITLRWHMQEGNVVFPKTTNPAHMASNLDIFDFELTDDEMAQINAIPQRAYYNVPEEAPAWIWGPNDYSKQA